MEVASEWTRLDSMGCQRRARCARSRQRCVAVRSHIDPLMRHVVRRAARRPRLEIAQQSIPATPRHANSRWRPVSRFSRRPASVRAGVAAQLQHIGAAIRVLGFRVQDHGDSDQGVGQRRPIPRGVVSERSTFGRKATDMQPRPNRDLSLTTLAARGRLASPTHEPQAHAGTASSPRRSLRCRSGSSRLHRGSAGRLRDRDRELAAVRRVQRPPAARRGQKRGRRDLHVRDHGVRAGADGVRLLGAADRG